MKLTMKLTMILTRKLTRKKRLTGTLVLLLLLIFSSPTILAENYYWMDGDLRRSLQIVPLLAAGFGDHADQMTAEEKERLMSVADKKGGATVYRLDPDLSPSAEAELFVNSRMLSPVFEDSGGLKALPGDVTVIFKDAADLADPANAKKILEKLTGQRIHLEPLSWHPSGYIVKTAPGLASLNIANRIADDKEFVLLASPNWWHNSLGPR